MDLDTTPGSLAPPAVRMSTISKRTVRDIDVAGKAVLVRVDFNVTCHPGTTRISDDSRIRASLPTVRYLLERRCRVVLCSHLGRPNGREVEELRMAPVSRRLSELLGMPVTQARDCIGAETKRLVGALPRGAVLMLQNLRFHPGEESNNAGFAAALGSLADIYVNDAFGAAHRAHASTAGVTRYLPAVAGFLMARELQMLGDAMGSPRRPFVAVLGGAKVSDKIAVLHSLMANVDTLIVGGGMAATFFRAQGLAVGASLTEDDLVPSAGDIIQTADELGVRLLLPEDLVVADEFSATALHQEVRAGEIPPDWLIMDIGRRSTALFEGALESAKTVVWNGPMGVFEWEPFAEGTGRIARALARLRGATTIIGGGSTADIVSALGLAEKMTHVSTGGGAALELLSGRSLPGVDALIDNPAPAAG